MRTRGTGRRRTLGAASVLVTGVLAVGVLAGCGSDPAPGDPLLGQRPAASVTVRVGHTALGDVLTNTAGHTLYLFPPDARTRVSCVGACAGVWPPLAVTAGGRAVAGDGARTSLLGTLPDPDTGGRVVTYAGYPLYTYSGDLAAGEVNGQSLVNSGGPWYALTPAGRPVTTARR